MDSGSKNTDYKFFFKVIIWDQLLKVYLWDNQDSNTPCMGSTK
jgi:hypothetical protein